MRKAAADFQIFAKPVSRHCNLSCSYCYYRETEDGDRGGALPQMSAELLAAYIRQHIAAHPGETVNFSWHGGEPTLLGLDFFRRVVELQEEYCPARRRITNGVQTNGTLIDDNWARFLADHRFSVGLSLDGPRELHDLYRRRRDGSGSHEAAMRGYDCLARHGVATDVLCVVNDQNVMYPLQLYRFFTAIGVRFLSFLPLVEVRRAADGGAVVSERSVPAEAFGAFLCTVFDAWLAADIGTIKVQIFEEALRTAFGQDHSLCLFRPSCGDIPVVESNGDVYPCDHFVHPDRRLGNIGTTPLAEILHAEALLSFGAAKAATLPGQCRRCEVRAMCNGECPKNRFVDLPETAGKLNYLCAGYRLFFRHCAPFVAAVARRWRESGGPDQGPAAQPARNEPCPCGSGRKYKKCCGGPPRRP